MKNELNQIQYEDGMSEKLEEQRSNLGNQIRAAQQKVTGLEARYAEVLTSWFLYFQAFILI